jgi:hypothetical protein
VSLDWNWSDLLTGLAGVVLGWLAKLVHIGNSSPPPPKEK